MGVVFPEMDLVAEEGLLDAGGGGEVDGRLDLIGHTSVARNHGVHTGAGEVREGEKPELLL